MAVTVEWEDEEQTIIRVRYDGDWNTKEFRDAALKVILMIRNQTHSVYTITDYTKSGPPPLGVLRQAGELSGTRSKNWAGGIAIIQDSLIRSLMEIYMHVYMLTGHQSRQRIARTNEEALDIIAHMKQESSVH